MRLRHAAVTLAVITALAALPPRAHAEGFISPLIGFNFAGDSACPAISGCQDKRMNYGIALGAEGTIFGFEEEFAYAKDFFGTSPNLTNSSVLTLMSNFLLAPKVGPVRPYFATGVGLIKTHVDFTTTSLLTTDNNNFGWDIGGGLHVTVAPHVGVRGDIRYFHTFQDLTGSFGFSFGANQKLDYGRAAAAVDFTF